MLISVQHKYSVYYKSILKKHQLFQLSSTDVTFKLWCMTVCIYSYFRHTHYMAQVVPICPTHNGSPSFVARLVKSIKPRSASFSLLLCSTEISMPVPLGKGSEWVRDHEIPHSLKKTAKWAIGKGRKGGTQEGRKKKERVQETGKGTRKGKSLGKDLGGDLSVHKKAAQSVANFRHRSMLFPFSWKSHKKKNGRNTEVKVGICTDSYPAKHTTTSGTTERNYGLQPSSCAYWALLPVP